MYQTCTKLYQTCLRELLQSSILDPSSRQGGEDRTLMIARGGWHTLPSVWKEKMWQEEWVVDGGGGGDGCVFGALGGGVVGAGGGCVLGDGGVAFGVGGMTGSCTIRL